MATIEKHNRFHDNLIYGFGCLDSSRPLRWDDIKSPRVYGRPQNLRQIVSWWGRVKAAWLVFTLNAVAVKWYDEKNAHTHGDNWNEHYRQPSRIDPASVGLPPYPTGIVDGPCVCGSWPGGECLKCPVRPA